MSTVIGKRMIDGAGVKYHSAGNGLARNVASSLIGSVGNALVNAIAKKVKGDGFKVAGEGNKKKAKKTNKKKK
jgi:hypothetical protein